MHSISSITRLRIITGINAFTCKLLICPKVDLKSTKLEVHLFMKCMEWAKGKFGTALSEVCTDGHVTIASLMGKLLLQFLKTNALNRNNFNCR